MLAEACQMPHEVRKYFGETGDEFHMGFHFPVMPRVSFFDDGKGMLEREREKLKDREKRFDHVQIYMSIKREDGTCLKEIMENTPDIPPNCQWVTFLRNHDELTLGTLLFSSQSWHLLFSIFWPSFPSCDQRTHALSLLSSLLHNSSPFSPSSLIFLVLGPKLIFFE